MDKTSKRKLRYPQIEFDKLQMYFGEPYTIDVEGASGTITIYQPTIGDIVRCGEKAFYSTLNIFVTNTTAYRLMLWSMGKDWNIMSDFDLFCLLYKQIDNNASKLMFRDVDFSNFELYTKRINDTDTVVLYDKESDVEINEDVYQHMSQYLRDMFNIHPEEKITSDKILKEMYIRKDQSAIDNASKKKNKDDTLSSIQPLISACVNHPGFKHTLSDFHSVGVCEFYDSVQRLNVYEHSIALLGGLYGGMMDGSKIRPESYDFMKEI